MPGMTMRMNVRRTATPFNPLVYSPALWLDASDQSTLIMDGARTFNGSSQAFTKAHNSTHPDASGDFWISAFIYLNATDASYRSAITKADTTILADWLVSKNNVNQMYFTVDYDSTDTPPSGVSVTSNVTMTATTWYHVFVYYNYSSGVIGISVNGESFVTATKARVLGVNSKTLSVGANANGAFNFWNGKLDSVAFGKPTSGWLASNATALRDYLYNSGSGRRSSDFLASAYYTGGNPSGAVSWWDMDARSGNETDRIGSNNLTDNGGVGYAAGVASGLVQYTGDPVKQWSDKSGNARHVTAAADSRRPTYTTAVQNSLPAVTFDGVDDFLYLAASAVGRNKSGVTVFVVKKGTGTSSVYRALLSGRNGTDTGDRFGVYQTNASGKPEVGGRRLDADSYAFAASASGATTSAEITCGVFDYANSDCYLYINNSLVGSNTSFQTAGSTSNTDTATIGIGAGVTSALTGASFFGGLVCEIAIVESALAVADLALWSRYLGNKWGITVP